MLNFQKQWPPCRWKKIRDISASRLPRVGDGGVGLVDEGKRIHLTIHEPVTASVNCPSSYKWYSTGEPRVRVVQKVEESSSEEGEIKALQPKEILYAASVTLSWSMNSTCWERDLGLW